MLDRTPLAAEMVPLPSLRVPFQTALALRTDIESPPAGGSRMRGEEIAWADAWRSGRATAWNKHQWISLSAVSRRRADSARVWVGRWALATSWPWSGRWAAARPP